MEIQINLESSIRRTLQRQITQPNGTQQWMLKADVLPDGNLQIEVRTKQKLDHIYGTLDRIQNGEQAPLKMVLTTDRHARLRRYLRANQHG